MIVYVAVAVVLVVVAVLFAAQVAIYPAAYIHSLRNAPPEDSINLLTMLNDHRVAVYTAGRVTPDSRVILYSHGNAVSLSHYKQNGDVVRGNGTMHVEELSRLTGLPVVSYDYPRYGASEGFPTEKSCCACADAAYDHIISLGVKPGNVVALGHSLGCGPTLHVARRPVGDVILLAPFTSVLAVKLPRWMIVPALDVFDNVKAIKAIPDRVKIFHGNFDAIIRREHSEALCAAAGDRCDLTLLDCGHNDIFDQREFYGAVCPAPAATQREQAGGFGHRRVV